MKKTLVAAALTTALSGAAVADPIYIDVGVDFGGNSDTAAGDTTTGWLDQLTVLYTSTSTIFDNDASGTLTAGDTILSAGGTESGAWTGLVDLSTNRVDGLEPGQTPFGGPSDNDFDTSWGLTFGFDDLSGVWTGTGFAYTSGTISMYYWDDSMSDDTDLIRLFDLSVATGGDTGNATVLFGNVGNFGTDDVNGVDAGDVFNTALGSFEDYINANAGNQVLFGASQDTQPLGDLTFVNGEAAVSGLHNGSINFQVSEPATLAVLGLGLLGIAATGRRKKA